VTAVAAARGVDPVALPPIYESVDVDALNALLAGAPDRPGDVEGRVTFTYAGYAITVDFDGLVRLRPTGNVSADDSLSHDAVAPDRAPTPPE